MTFEALHNAIRSRFNTEVVVPEDLSVCWENADFDKPEPQEKVWAKTFILLGETQLVSIGAKRRWRIPGIFMIQLFYLLKEGTKDLAELADKINTAFRGVSAGGVTYRAPSMIQVGRSENWWQVNFNCPFYSDDVEA